MQLNEVIRDRILLSDGGMGTLLQKVGLTPGQRSETWNLTHPDVVTDIHREYIRAGSRMITANTFGANTFYYGPEQLDAVVSAGIACARRAAEEENVPALIALDIGPTGKLPPPLGNLDFEQAVACFAAVAKAGYRAGADAVLIETMCDLYEAKAAVLGVREACPLPVMVSFSFDGNGVLLTGADVDTVVATVEGLSVDAVGINCSAGPDALTPVIGRMLSVAHIPVLFQPNAGMPVVTPDGTVFPSEPDEFAETVARVAGKGLSIVGGCCGTTPRHIAALERKLKGVVPVKRENPRQTVVTSGQKSVAIGRDPVIIGERINPTGKAAFKQALLNRDIPFILEKGIEQETAGAHVLDVNVGMPGIDEADMLPRIVRELQTVTGLPLQIDTSDVAAMESAVRVYNGKPLINSVNGKDEVLDSVLPIMKKYGGVAVALTLDENGIPTTVEGRLAVARHILERGRAYGFDANDFVFDPLTMTVGTDPNAALTTLKTVRALCDMGLKTVLGISNVSFGLPGRPAVNAAFFQKALTVGLSAAIINPCSPDMMLTFDTHRVLSGLDANARDYIAHQTQGERAVAGTGSTPDSRAADTTLTAAIEKGLSDKAAQITEKLLASGTPGTDVVTEWIIPALDRVGRDYETGTAFLPQLMVSAAAASAAFDVIRSSMRKAETGRGPMVVLATVRGDIHDLGKNLVRLLLESYAFNVVDLGFDVPAERILEAVVQHNAPVVGLSALMTTTLPAMEKTVALLKKEAPGVRVVVGGAVLTREFADRIGADCYAPDAMATVNFVKETVGRQS